jgi:cell division protein FtsB
MKEKPQGTRAGWRLPDWLLPVSKADLNQLLNKIMSAIETFGTAVNASFDKLGTAVDGVAADVDFLKAEIKKLQDNPGPISPADQAILDGIQARADQLDQKVEALDAMTSQPPVPPTP